MTIRQTPTSAELVDPALDFTPVPRKPRIDGWTPERQRAFIAALAQHGTVVAAAKQVAMSAEGAYYLRRQRGAEEFARAWARAHATGVRALRDVAYERAVQGTPRGVWYKGERVGEERRYNDRLLMFMLRREQPAAYGAPSLLPSGTKHPDTLAREARWAEAEDAVFAEEEEAGGKRAQTNEKLIALYRAKALDERALRLRGDPSAANHALRQLTLMELVLSVDTDVETARTIWPAALDIRSQGEAYSKVPIALLLAHERQKAWEQAGDPPRPDPDFWWPKLKHWSSGGPNWKARDTAREEARKMVAHGTMLHEATQTEESWAAWLSSVENQAPLP